MVRIAASLRALLSNLIDYAGLYPPASLPMAIVLERYRCFRASPEAWILNRLVLPAGKLGEVTPGPGWRITLLVDREPGPLPPQVETLETGLVRPLSLPTYCEAPVEQIAGTYVKYRTGGVAAALIPSTAQVASFLCRAAARRLPFKATAGLHHPIRSIRPLTYTPESERAYMHGFLNVFTAAAFAWYGMDEAGITGVLEETDAAAIEFADDGLDWRGHRLGTEQIRCARREFAHSFGSCSFEEPVSELRELELLP